MQPRSLEKATTASTDPPLAACEELLRHAIDRIALDTAWLSPRERARLASAAAVLKEIRETLRQGRGARQGTGGKPVEPKAAPAKA
ncbi:hypothetical protein [Mesorhizobium sp. B2-3-4]|uniref:hypothetical protein n=1 Tax=Mesorhizobium sp. B2-3-4 TaxID=2589959 RepID=UPI00112C934B|nr:hypothetical protein [Mesorhizobium sp. B2-3-4]TPM31533.1 hypothetical protein FJ967_25205 [Mesorhizobium sp. B2-3-4]